MITPTVLFHIIFLASVSCKTDFREIYDGLANEVINVKELEKTVRVNLPGTDAEIDPFWLFIDSWAKIPSGILAGNFYDLGHFDECYGIHYNDTYGKYCLGTLKASPQTQKYFDVLNLNATHRIPRFQVHPQPRVGVENIGLRWAVCVPHTVPAADIPGLITYTEDFCYSKATEPALSNGAIVTIVILGIFLGIAVVSTAFDVYLAYAEKKAPHELLIAFSCLTNGRKIFKSTNNPDQLLCLNGIKAISMMWVIFGHEYSNVLKAAVYNVLVIQDMEQNSANMFLMGATLSVDTFFVVGGLVTVYTYLKAMDKGVKFNIILYYIHRYLRITPALAIMALIHLYLLNYLGSGPLWITVDKSLVETCRQGWWSTFLYITNYVQKGICLPQGWYLSVDMQLYILSPLVLVPLCKWPKKTLGGLGILAVAGCVVPFAIGYSLNIGSLFAPDDGTQKYMNQYYIQTYTRFGPYVIGMILGYLLYKVKQKQLKIQMSRLVACFWWFICLTGLVACLYAEHPLIVAKEDDIWGNSMFLAFDRPGWAIFLSGVILLCVSGYGHPVDKFLSLPIFQFLTKVSYSMYLTHFAVITARYAAMKNEIRFSHGTFMYAFWADFMITLGLSLILCLLFESPIIILEKYIFGRETSKPQNKESDKTKLEV